MRPLFFILSFLAFLPFSMAQRHLLPEHRGEGVPGPVDNSFVIVWESVPGATGYEYVLSDNRFCFKGCAGDTRESVTRDTFATEFALQPDISYYWITRIFFANGDTSDWTLISRFNTTPVDIRPLFVAAPSPLVGRQLQLFIDWAAIPDIQSLDWELIDLQGRRARPTGSILRGSSIFRVQDYTVDLSGASPGMYQIYVSPKASDGTPLRPIQQKIILQ
ncbi:MAG: hypothetical protein AAFV78_01865 [Bacteroidota bacterium]